MFFLAVVAVRSVFSKEMLVQQLGRHCSGIRVECQRAPGHVRYLFEHYHILHCPACVFSPGERPVGVNQHPGNRLRIEFGEPFGDHISGFNLVAPLDLLCRERPG